MISAMHGEHPDWPARLLGRVLGRPSHFGHVFKMVPSLLGFNTA